MGENEAGTLAQLKDCRTSLALSTLALPAMMAGSSRSWATALLVEFSSAVDAVQSALDLQTAMAKRNDNVPSINRMTFRVGVHLGDVIVKGEDIYGEGVNVVARLEGLSDAGSICVSDDVYRQVRGKVDAKFDDLNPQQIKNMKEPVWAFRVSSDAKSRVATPVRVEPWRPLTNLRLRSCPSSTFPATRNRSILPTASPRTSSHRFPSCRSLAALSMSSFLKMG